MSMPVCLSNYRVIPFKHDGLRYFSPEGALFAFPFHGPHKLSVGPSFSIIPPLPS